MTWLPDLARADAALVISLVAIVAGVVIAAVVGRLAGLASAGVVLIALTPLIPALRIPSALGLSSDDILPLLGSAVLVVALLRAGAAGKPWEARPRLRRLQLVVVGGLGLVLVGGTISAVVNGDGPLDAARLLFRGAGRFAFLAVIVWLVTQAVARRPDLPTVAGKTLAVMGTVEAAFGLFAYFFPLPGHLGLAVAKRYSVLFGDVPGRIAGTLGISPNFTGAVLMVTLLVTVGLALGARGRVRAIWLGCAVLQLVALALTFSRAPLGLALVGTVVLVLLASRPILVLPLLGAAGVVAAVTPLLGRFFTDATDRLALWTSGFRMMLDHPLAGVGPGQMVVVMRENPDRYVHTGVGIATSNAHNTILLAGAEMGVIAAVGALLINIALALMAFQLIRAALAARPRGHLGLAAALATLAFLAQGMVNNLFTVGATSVVFALVTGAFAWHGVGNPSSADRPVHRVERVPEPGPAT